MRSLRGRVAVGVAGALLLVAAGCGDGDGNGGTSWRGEDSHLVTEGAIDGQPVDIDLSGAELVDTGLQCQLEYLIPGTEAEPDYENGKLVEIKVEGFVDVGGERRGLEIEFKQHDFQSDEDGTVVMVVPRNDASPPGAGEAWLEWEWHDATTDDELLEVAAVNGTITVESNGIVVDDTGLLADPSQSTFGLTFDVRFSETEQASGSLTLNCDEVDVEFAE